MHEGNLYKKKLRIKNQVETQCVKDLCMGSTKELNDRTVACFDADPIYITCSHVRHIRIFCLAYFWDARHD